MNLEISRQVKKGLSKSKSHETLRSELLQMGYQKIEIEEALQSAGNPIKKRSHSGRFIIKDLLDRVGYGFGSVQYINILFYLVSGSVFLLGVANAIRTVLSLLSMLVLEEYCKIKSVYKRMIGYSGLILGFTFILFAAAVYLHSTVMFLIVLWINAIAIVPYGSLYQKMFRQSLIEERKKYIIGRLSYAGLGVTCLALIGSAALLDMFAIDGKSVTISGTEIMVYGYLIVMAAASLSIIISSYILYFLFWRRIEEHTGKSLMQGVIIAFGRAKEYWLAVQKDKVLLVMTLTGILLGIIQALGSSYYGLFIFKRMADQGFGSWMNVAAVFVLATLATAFAPSITRSVSREYGKVPMLAFGAALMAIMPLSFAFNPTLVTVSMGTIVGIIGSSINGVATGLIIRDRVKDAEIPTYIQMNTILSVLPYLIFIPVGAVFAEVIGISKLFVGLAAILVVIVLPAYFGILLMHRHDKV